MEQTCRLIHKTPNSGYCNLKICPNCEDFVEATNENYCMCCMKKIKKVKNQTRQKIAEKFAEAAKNLYPYIKEYRKLNQKECVLCVPFTFGLTIYNVNLSFFAEFLSVEPDEYDLFLNKVKKKSTTIAFNVW